MANGAGGEMSSAQPDALGAFAEALSLMVDELVPKLQALGAEALAYQLKPHPGGPDLSDFADGTDPAARAAVTMGSLAERVRSVALAFRMTNESGVSFGDDRRAIVTSTADLDRALTHVQAAPVFHDQPPLSGRLVAAGDGAAGGVVGPDGRIYPLSVDGDGGAAEMTTVAGLGSAAAVAALAGVGSAFAVAAGAGWRTVAVEVGKGAARPGGAGATGAYTVVYEQHADGRRRAEMRVPETGGPNGRGDVGAPAAPAIDQGGERAGVGAPAAPVADERAGRTGADVGVDVGAPAAPTADQPRDRAGVGVGGSGR